MEVMRFKFGVERNEDKYESRNVWRRKKVSQHSKSHANYELHLQSLPLSASIHNLLQHYVLKIAMSCLAAVCQESSISALAGPTFGQFNWRISKATHKSSA